MSRAPPTADIRYSYIRKANLKTTTGYSCTALWRFNTPGGRGAACQTRPPSTTRSRHRAETLRFGCAYVAQQSYSPKLGPRQTPQSHTAPDARPSKGTPEAGHAVSASESGLRPPWGPWGPREQAQRALWVITKQLEMMCWSQHIISVDADHEGDVEGVDQDDVGVVAEHVAAQYLLSKTRASHQADVAGVVDAEIWR